MLQRFLLSFLMGLILLPLLAPGLNNLSYADSPEPRIDLHQVNVGGEIGRRIDITINNNLLVLDADKDFLLPFQTRDRKGGYIGLGKLIDSAVRLAAYSQHEELIALKKHIVDETLKTQEADGYIGMFAPGKRMWALWDIHEMAYLVNGLVSDYHFFGEQKSLDAAKKLMDYIMRRWQKNPDGLKGISITVFMAVTGLEETLLMLYDATQDKRYLDFCINFRELPQWDYPIVQGRWGKIGGHAYAFFHRCLAQLRLHQIQPSERLLSQTEKALHFLNHNNGLLINGVCSQHECWHDTQDGTEGLGETCSTAYLIRVLDELIGMEHKSFYGDMMERAIYNGLFAAQSPDGRRIRYYVPFEGKREYFHGDTYCCPCNYRRIIAELPSMIYYRMNDGVAINLFTPSKANIPFPHDNTVTIRQETDYPNSGKVRIFVKSKKLITFPLYIRIPTWCKNASLSLDNQQIELSVKPGGFYCLEKTWGKEIQLTLAMEMPFRFIIGRRAQAGRVAVMRGPQLYCLNPSRNDELGDADLRQIIIDPNTLEGPFPDDTIRPDGMACTIKGWRKMGFTTGGNHQFKITLTEFPDPAGEATYFRIRKLGRVGEKDELIFNE